MNTALHLGLRLSLSPSANRSSQLLLTLLALWFPPLACADFGVNLQPPASDLARLRFRTILWICAAPSCLSRCSLRSLSTKAGASTAKFHDNLKLILWTVVPVLQS